MNPVFWIFGRPGSGKSTLSLAMAHQLSRPDAPCVILDSDDMRQGLCKNLGYTFEDRTENVRRLAECAEVVRCVAPVVVCAVTPSVSMRELARSIIPELHTICLMCSDKLAAERGKAMWDGTHFDPPSLRCDLMACSDDLMAPEEMALAILNAFDP